ncbi:hypothetical protein BJX61DRAFT_547923 [Aspergillus egyptiacus]|nr:hypothetical protein BJX61DRAFT_547923 [Aspergillus egyptiacus]
MYIVTVHDVDEVDPWVYRPSSDYKESTGVGPPAGGRDLRRVTVSGALGNRGVINVGYGSENSASRSFENKTGDQLLERRPTRQNSEGFGLPRRMSRKLSFPLAGRLFDPGEAQSHQSTEGETAASRSVRWLDDPSMLPRFLPQASVLNFTYPKPPPGGGSWEIYVYNVAIQFLHRLKEWEETLAEKRPILYIGHGLGGLILQAAAPRAGSEEIDTGYIFLNTPFPEFAPSSFMEIYPSKYGIFPLGQVFRPYDSFKRIQAGQLWRSFVKRMGGEVQKLPIAWLYKASEVSAGSFPDSFFSPLAGSSSSRFAGPEDRDFQCVVARIRSLIALHASKHAALLDLLRMVFTAGNFPKNVRDGEGRSPLHLAASSRNPQAALFLVNQARQGLMVIKSRDIHGRTALHDAVKAAADLKPDQDRAPSRTILILLLSSTLDIIGQSDRAGRIAWDHLDDNRPDHDWLHALRRKCHGHLVLKPFGSPNISQERACRDSWALVAEFHATESDPRIRCNCAEVPVYEVLYEQGPRKVLFHSRLLNATEVLFKWIHFPANNKQWAEDLFTGLGLQDSSMENQQRKGSAAPFNYFFAKAEEYTHSKITYQGRDPNEWPAAPDISEAANLQPLKQDHRAIALFMPILSYETRDNLLILDKHIQAIAKGGTVETNDFQLDLFKAYKVDSQLHPRRPLDQFSYISRAEDQILPTLGWNSNNDPCAPVLMVDQLWLWILHDGTVVTCFPDTSSARAEYNLKTILHEDIIKEHRFETVDELVTCIIQHSIDFLVRPGPEDVTFAGGFQTAINYVSHHATALFTDFEKFAAKITDEATLPTVRTQLVKNMLNFEEESRLLLQIRDIQDELNIVKSVVEQQKGVLEQLSRVSLPFHMSSNQLRTGDDAGGGLPSERHNAGLYAIHEQSPEEILSYGSKFRNALRGGIRSRVDDNIRVITGMLDYAARIEHSIDHLLDLKQKQANALEARFAREGSEQTRRQGNIMLYWTTITIVFLPLSFLSSFFSLDVAEFPKGATGETEWPLQRVSGYLFGASFSLIIPLLIIGFSLRFSATELREILRFNWFKEGSRSRSTRRSSSIDLEAIGPSIKEKKVFAINSSSPLDLDYEDESESSSSQYISYKDSPKRPRRAVPGPLYTIRKFLFRRRAIFSRAIFWRRAHSHSSLDSSSSQDDRTIDEDLGSSSRDSIHTRGSHYYYRPRRHSGAYSLRESPSTVSAESDPPPRDPRRTQAFSAAAQTTLTMAEAQEASSCAGS